MVRIQLTLTAILAVFLIAGCDVLSMSFNLEARPSPTAVRNVLATRPMATTVFIPTSTPVPVATWTPETIPSATEASLSPPTAVPPAADTNGFCCLHFAPGPLAPAAETFPAGTEIVYAIWDYTALQPGDRIRRIWIRDDLIWLARDEKWDWEKYGASGTVRDLSIFDYEGSGLQPGSYKLQLYRNDVLQQEGAFIISAP